MADILIFCLNLILSNKKHITFHKFTIKNVMATAVKTVLVSLHVAVFWKCLISVDVP